MYREKRRNKTIILILVGIICLMGVGYAAFNTRLNITGTSNISSDWNIRIISADVTDTGGDGENVKNNYTDLTADLEANLYGKGDYVEYSIIVENAGTFDAKLESIGITNSNNEAVLITSSGLTKGQTLYKNTTATLTVRIEYNYNYEGDASGTSGESTIDLDFVQNSGGTIEPTTDHLVTYDYQTNGGESTTAENAYVPEGENIDLSYTAEREGYDFIGWNTNAQAGEGLTELTMGTSDVTLYAIFKQPDTTPPVIENVSTTSTTNSITVVITASDLESGISKYEFKIDDGEWIDNEINNSYTFTGLTQNTGYDISVRVTNGVDLTTEEEVSESIDLTDNVVNSGAGLYEDGYEDGVYTYRGANPNNYVSFNNELWRIVALEKDGTIKIVRNELLPLQEWDVSGGTYGSNIWARPAELNTYLNETYYTNDLNDTYKNYLTNHSWNIGPVTSDNNDLNSQIEDETSNTWEGNIGLIALSDYYKANTNMSQCGTYSLNETNYETCKTTNWLVPTSGYYWTITPRDINDFNVFNISSEGNVRINGASRTDVSPRPAAYLKSSINIIEGDGSSSNPFILETGIGTSVLNKPTFSEVETDNGKTVTINYPEGDGLTYEYQKDNDDWTTATQSQQVEFTESGTLVARVSDGINTETATYVVKVFYPGAAGTIQSLVSTNSDELYIDNNENIRYYGANPNNYVTFNNQLWRIIGVIDGKVKIIKDTSIGNSLGWDSAGDDNWDTSSLKAYLNGNYYYRIKSFARPMISEETYYLGDYIEGTDVTPSQAYDRERNGIVLSGNPETTNQYIGIMYPSDYGYASGESCLNTNIRNFDEECKDLNYLFSGDDELMISPAMGGYVFLDSTGYVNIFSNTTYSKHTRPVLYLSNDTEIVGGTGSVDEPFELYIDIDSTAPKSFFELAELTTSGNGLYSYAYEDNIYTYRGANPNNYVTFNDEEAGWRILSADIENKTIKIVRSTVLEYRQYDTASGRFQSYDEYCNDYNYGCNIWGGIGTLYDENMNLITELAYYNTGTKYTLPNTGSYLNTYLNSTYYNSLTSEAKKMIIEGIYRSGRLIGNSDSQLMDSMNLVKWKGKVALIDASEYYRTSTGTNCRVNFITSSCGTDNWLNINDYYFTMTPSDSVFILRILYDGTINMPYANSSSGVLPVVTLSKDVKITGGDGSEENPFTLS